MEEDKEDDPNTIISFPRRDGDGTGHWAGLGEGFTRGWGGDLAGQRSGLQCSDLMAVWVCAPKLSSCFPKTRYRN